MWWAPFLVRPVERSVALQNGLRLERWLGGEVCNRKRRRRSTERAAMRPNRSGRSVRTLFRHVCEDWPFMVLAHGRVHCSAMMLAVDSAAGGQRRIFVVPQSGGRRCQQQQRKQDEQNRSAHAPQLFHHALPVRRHGYAHTRACFKSRAAARPGKW